MKNKKADHLAREFEAAELARDILKVIIGTENPPTAFWDPEMAADRAFKFARAFIDKRAARMAIIENDPSLS